MTRHQAEPTGFVMKAAIDAIQAMRVAQRLSDYQIDTLDNLREKQCEDMP